ncbi:DNA-binding protein [Sorangium cellulosum]|uniref:DNA-binding protein n=1 Tax=Sorangium cellulosum TaxID=56 RepID=A0A4P2QAG6_SORCE|nr:DNA-binding protein [Sorangium cellulosum]AUX26063.1 DNA-binding protein [Sorangium cellulosum]
MSNVETEIRSHVDTFVSQLSALVRKAALEAVADALREGQPVAAVAAPRKAGGRAKAAPPPPAEVKKAAGRPARAAKPARKKGEKRSKEELAAMTQRVLEHIRANSGQGVEQIAKDLGTTTKELTLPIRKLLVEKKITSKGEKRATKYFSR